jgi:hypothetical protein
MLQEPAGKLPPDPRRLCAVHDTYLVADGVAQQRNRMGLPLHDTVTSVGWLLIRCFITICVPAPNHCRGGLHSLRAQHGGSHRAAGLFCALRRGVVCFSVPQLDQYVGCCCLMHATSGSCCASWVTTSWCQQWCSSDQCFFP